VAITASAKVNPSLFLQLGLFINQLSLLNNKLKRLTRRRQSPRHGQPVVLLLITQSSIDSSQSRTGSIIVGLK
jgi:hypothetical protein